MISIRDLTYHYPATETPALRSISTAIADGAVTLLVGPNGAGKSTLCFALGGYVPHHFHGQIEGEVLLDGWSSRETPLRQWVTRVGMVFQNPFNQITGARTTVFEEVAYGLENLGVPRDEMIARVSLVLEQLRIADLAERSPFALSGGQQQRVAMASIMVLRPRVLVLDEPTAQLDPVGSREVLDVLADIAATGATVALATHQFAEAAGFASKALLLAGGRLLRDAPARSVLADPVLDDLQVGRPAPTRLAHLIGLPPPWPLTVDEAVPFFRTAMRAVGSRPVLAQTSEVSGDFGSLVESHPPVPTRVAVENAGFTYPGGVEALRGVNLTLEPGTVTALVGENGAGKTTLSKLINGLLRPTTGVVRVGDWLAAEHPVSELARRVGYVFQNPDDQLFKSTIWDEVAFGPRNLGVAGSDLDSAVARALDLAGLGSAADVHPYDLQPAERRWVAIASVLAMATPVIVFDEPTTGQDRRGIGRLVRLLRHLRRAGHTILTITHDMVFAAEMADEVVVMAGGTILTAGSPAVAFADEALLRRARVDAPPVARLARALGMGHHIVTEGEFLSAWVEVV